MEDAAHRLLAGDQRTLSRLISYLERGDPQAAGVLKTIDPHTGKAYIVGITGPPGAGKSTLVDRLTELLRGKDISVGIIGVDPTSPGLKERSYDEDPLVPLTRSLAPHIGVRDPR